MTLRGRISTLPDGVEEKLPKIVDMYYNQKLKQQQIKTMLELPSVSVVAEVLRRDMLSRVEHFKKIDAKDPSYRKSLTDIISFLKKDRKMEYSSISTLLNITKTQLFSVISDENSGLRNSLSMAERTERNNEMKRLSMEEGLSITEIGKKMGVSKQMVSRIFDDMGYKPIRGTRNLRARMSKISELNNFVVADCNAKIQELSNDLVQVKNKFASHRQYSNKVIIELRCALVQSLSEHLTILNFPEFKSQSAMIKKIFNQYNETTTEDTRPIFYELLADTLKIVDRVKNTTIYKSLNKTINNLNKGDN